MTLYHDSAAQLCAYIDNSVYLQGNVIYCASFSKTVAQGLRIGWVVLPERFFRRAEYLKYVANLAAPTLPQLANLFRHAKIPELYPPHLCATVDGGGGTSLGDSG